MCCCGCVDGDLRRGSAHTAHVLLKGAGWSHFHWGAWAFNSLWRCVMARGSSRHAWSLDSVHVFHKCLQGKQSVTGNLSAMGSVDKSTLVDNSYLGAAERHPAATFCPVYGTQHGSCITTGNREYITLFAMDSVSFRSSGLTPFHTVWARALAMSSCPKHVTAQWMAPNSDMPASRRCPKCPLPFYEGPSAHAHLELRSLFPHLVPTHTWRKGLSST